MKIAAFDSGIGGLSAIAPLFLAHADLEVTYLGDLANLPYGTKSPKRVAALAERNLEWLLEHLGPHNKPDHLVIACNTASAHAMAAAHEVGKRHNVPVTGVLEPGCKFCLESKPSRVILLATASTVASGAYERTLRQLGFIGAVDSKACPLFVPLVEDDLVSGPAVEHIIKRYLDPLHPQRGDAVILGCTHYPFLSEALRSLYPEVNLIDAGSGLLREDAFHPRSVVTDRSPSLKLLFTDTTASRASIDRFLNRLGLSHVKIAVESVAPIL